MPGDTTWHLWEGDPVTGGMGREREFNIQCCWGVMEMMVPPGIRQVELSGASQPPLRLQLVLAFNPLFRLGVPLVTEAMF